MSPLRRQIAAQGGQALIEFALVAPLALVFLLAIVDFGIALDRRIVLDHAVREGARYAAVGGQALTTGVGATEGEIKAYTADQSQDIVDGTGAAGSDNYIDVCYEDSNGNGMPGDVGDNVRLGIHYRHDFVTGFTAFFNMSLASIDMDPSASARVERAVEGTPPLCAPWPP